MKNPPRRVWVVYLGSGEVLGTYRTKKKAMEEFCREWDDILVGPYTLAKKGSKK